MLQNYLPKLMSSIGHVGAPLACNIIKLEDVEEMNYYSANNEGEVGTSYEAMQL